MQVQLLQHDLFATTYSYFGSTYSGKGECCNLHLLNLERRRLLSQNVLRLCPAGGSVAAELQVIA